MLLDHKENLLGNIIIYVESVVMALYSQLSQLQSFAAHLQCWNLLPVAKSILEDRQSEGTNSPRRGLYHDLALFCSCLHEGSLDIGNYKYVIISITFDRLFH